MEGAARGELLSQSTAFGAKWVDLAINGAERNEIRSYASAHAPNRDFVCWQANHKSKRRRSCRGNVEKTGGIDFGPAHVYRQQGFPHHEEDDLRLSPGQR